MAEAKIIYAGMSNGVRFCKQRQSRKGAKQTRHSLLIVPHYATDKEMREAAFRVGSVEQSGPYRWCWDVFLENIRAADEAYRKHELPLNDLYLRGWATESRRAFDQAMLACTVALAKIDALALIVPAKGVVTR